MSLLEDVFLQDEANEAEELERVIEGDEFVERRRSDSDENSEKEDEAEEDKRKVDPTKAKTTRVVKNPRFILNPARLTGPRGIQVIPEHFKDFKFKGKGYEKEDLDLVLKKLEHWAYRLYPKFQFEDCLKKIEMLGKKRPVAVHLHKIRSDQFLSEDTVVQKDSSDDETPMPAQEEDEFDKLLQQQIELARSTPAPDSAKKPGHEGSISPKHKRTTSLMMPKATSSPSINDEQRKRMLRSRKLAEERRLARLKTAASANSTPVTTNAHSTEHAVNSESVEVSVEINTDSDAKVMSKKHNRSNVIYSSDEENLDKSLCITVDVHNSINKEVLENQMFHNDINKDVGDILNENDINNDDHQSSYKGIQIENEKDKLTNINCNSAKSESNEFITNDESNIDNNAIDNEVPQLTNNQDILNECSAEHEELRYDDSDINMELNEPNLTDDNNKDISTEKVTEPEQLEEIPNNTDVAKELDKQVSSLTEENGNKDVISEGAHFEKNQNVIEIDNNKSNNVSQELINDVMDVDFSEDF